MIPGLVVDATGRKSVFRCGLCDRVTNLSVRTNAHEAMVKTAKQRIGPRYAYSQMVIWDNTTRTEKMIVHVFCLKQSKNINLRKQICKYVWKC